MNLERLDAFNESAVRDAMALDEAARAVDEPHDPPMSLPSYTGSLRHGWDGEPGERWLLRDGGQVIGALGVHFPQRDNTHKASLGVVVHPDHRRQGLGRALFEDGLARVRAAGRRLVTSGSLDAPAPSAFAEAMGYTKASVEVQRRQDLAGIDHDRVAKLLAEAREAARDYTLLRFVGAIPDELVDEVATLTGAINDAPTDDLDVEDEIFDRARIRGFEAAQAASARQLYRLVVRQGTDGPLAGHTIVGAATDIPAWAWQYDTAVLREHRGHRLGLLLKAEMMAWLAEAEPSVRWLDTWNAESNAHMIGINEALGYQIAARHLGWQRPV
ncbi:GNAT family N-acetyltransferase [Actinopolymorpha alba]|uniref:GNAT family N-acetyltransferase n=1 Tax=Actinopolymorpha alba TaxID=533267 RepID=UPI000370AF5C|nr:GNAT family N-acetyltransferase [Actinopolymorpha alba]